MDERRACEQIRLEVEELRASRARILAAADDDRRRIERAIHDGVQQHLVSLVVNLQLARELADADPPAAKVLLEEISAHVREALDCVRELAYRVYPPLLIDRGLEEAVRAAAKVSGIPTRVHVEGLPRLPAEIEAAAYFCCVETLAEMSEDAGPGSRASLRLWHEPGALLLEVVGDSGGSELAGGRSRPRLTRVADRLAALGGNLEVSVRPGGGTAISGRVPCPS
jgi:signal transduction histidine kinase